MRNKLLQKRASERNTKVLCKHGCHIYPLKKIRPFDRSHSKIKQKDLFSVQISKLNLQQHKNSQVINKINSVGSFEAEPGLTRCPALCQIFTQKSAMKNVHVTADSFSPAHYAGKQIIGWYFWYHHYTLCIHLNKRLFCALC